MATTTQNRKGSSFDAKPLYFVAGIGDLAVEQIRELPEKISGIKLENAYNSVKAEVTKRVDEARETYEDLAARGHVLVERISKQSSTQRTKRQADTTEAKAKATSTTAKRGAAATKTQAKGAATSAAKTVDAAGDAVSDAAKKVGD